MARAGTIAPNAAINEPLCDLGDIYGRGHARMVGRPTAVFLAVFDPQCDPFMAALRMDGRTVCTVQILRPQNGWQSVIEWFQKDGAQTMRTYPQTRILLLIDFDNEQKRLDLIKSKIQEDVHDRVFVLGVWSNPEELRRQCGQPLEDIGFALAQDCVDDTSKARGHPLLVHNQPELQRMVTDVKSFLF